MIGQTTAIAEVKPVTTTDPSSGSSAPKDTHVTLGTGHLRVQGYTPTVTVGSAYAAAASVVPAPDRRAALLALEPTFQALPNPILHLIVEGAERAGPHVGNPDFPEETLQAFARYEQDQREKERLRKEAERAQRASWMKDFGLLVVGGIIGWLLG
jgi:hypothetical protein